VADNEMFKVLWAGKKKNKAWKRVVTKCTFVGENLMGDKSKALFNMSICNDTLFLLILNVLDYSILVGIDEEKMIQPPLYKARFTAAMDKYFFSVPTKWTTI